MILEKSLKPSLQCAEAAKKGMVVLGKITRAFQYRDRYIFLKLYVQFVRCHLEFAVWSPWHLGDIETLEKVQRRAVNYIIGLKGVTYEGKLRELCILLLSLANKRFRADLIQVFKILKGIDDDDITT